MHVYIPFKVSHDTFSARKGRKSSGVWESLRDCIKCCLSKRRLRTHLRASGPFSIALEMADIRDRAGAVQRFCHLYTLHSYSWSIYSKSIKAVAARLNLLFPSGRWSFKHYLFSRTTSRETNQRPSHTFYPHMPFVYTKAVSSIMPATLNLFPPRAIRLCLWEMVLCAIP